MVTSKSDRVDLFFGMKVGFFLFHPFLKFLKPLSVLFIKLD